jgi:hypothetical protein
VRVQLAESRKAIGMMASTSFLAAVMGLTFAFGEGPRIVNSREVALRDGATAGRGFTALLLPEIPKQHFPPFSSAASSS